MAESRTKKTSSDNLATANCNGDAQTNEFTYGDIITLKVKPRATGIALMSAPESNQMALYCGETQISDVADADGEGYYTLTYNTIENALPVGGEVTLTAKYVGNSNMADYSENITVNLAKAAAVLGAAPETVAGLVYNKCDYVLVTPGSNVAGGTLMYKLGEGEYTAELPKATNAGTYTVYYKVFGDANHNDTEEQSLEITIAPKAVSPQITLTAPVVAETPVTIVETQEYIASIVWSPDVSSVFEYGTAYTATVTVTAKANYTIAEIAENGYVIDGAEVTNAAGSGTLTAVFAPTAQMSSKSSAVNKVYCTVKFDTDGAGSIKSIKVEKNAKITEPDRLEKEGYTFDGWYTDKNYETPYDFDKAVTKGFTLYAKWIEIEKEPDNTDAHNCPLKAFNDLDVSAWYHLDTDYVIENGIFKGITDSAFAPNDKLTRAMLVTVLYRVEGEPARNRSIPFADIDMGAYYANAVIWSQQNGIVKGISETKFAPNDNITREQIAAIMHRYAEYKGIDVSAGEKINILSYDDFADISEYAIAAMQYACGSGLMKGKTESTLNPKDNATRAEIAAILYRFIEANK